VGPSKKPIKSLGFHRENELSLLADLFAGTNLIPSFLRFSAAMVEFSQVAECTIPECVYNRASRCYAVGVTIGNGERPECLTFHATNNHVPRGDGAVVGACKIPSCTNNRDFACRAQRIYVGYQGNEIACLAFRKE
jgi:hypothetical protein